MKLEETKKNKRLVGCDGLTASHDCYDCEKSDALKYCIGCAECKNLRNCLFCYGLQDAKYCVCNVQYTAEEFDEIDREFFYSLYAGRPVEGD